MARPKEQGRSRTIRSLSADVRRFLQLINTDEVFGTHTLAAMIFAGLPSTSFWAIGLLVEINMIFGGVALTAMALHAQNAA
jgi:hypothetical protein